jgi:SAM-dependent MidA family methyltransferase
MHFIELFEQHLGEKKAIPFVDFMHMALYAPHVGYYTSGLPVLGKAGDFITAPELTPLFGQTLANQCQAVLSTLEKPVILEFGAGSGRLCVDLLTQLQQLNALPDEYQILDVSAHLKQQQQTLIQREIPALFDRVTWLTQWPQHPIQGILLANEVLDAMPVHRFLNQHDGLLESYIGLNQNHQLQETFLPCTNNQLKAHVQSRLAPDQMPYLSEANLFLEGWLQQCFNTLSAGMVLVIDYGFPSHEYYHPDRCQGTLMCHYHHQAHTDALAHPGEQDITAHVDFTHVAEAASQAGFHVAGYTHQAAFLLNNGLLELLAKQSPGDYRAQQAVKQLVQPSEMGELFKVMALTKSVQVPLSGFQLHDKRGTL